MYQTNKAMNKNRIPTPRNNRFIHFEIGMIVALLLILSAFEFKSYEKYDITIYRRNVDNTPVEHILATRHEKEHIDPPKPKFTIKITDIKEDIYDEPDFDVMADESTEIQNWEPEIEPEERIADVDEFIFIASQMPEFSGGISAMMSFLSKNINYPEIAKQAGISGIVFVGFIIEKNGSLSNIELLRSIGGGCDEEALRVVKLMPNWIPGKQRGLPVRVKLNLPVKFTLR